MPPKTKKTRKPAPSGNKAKQKMASASASASRGRSSTPPASASRKTRKKKKPKAKAGDSVTAPDAQLPGAPPFAAPTKTPATSDRTGDENQNSDPPTPVLPYSSRAIPTRLDPSTNHYAPNYSRRMIPHTVGRYKSKAVKVRVRSLYIALDV